MKQTKITKKMLFADIVKLMGKSDQDYAIPVTTSNKQLADAYLKQLMLVEEAFNQGKERSMADTDQAKYYPYFRVIPDEQASGGFRLAFCDYGYDCAYSALGVRPEYLTSGDACQAGEQFLAIYEKWAQHAELARKNREY
jgi:hypothetical protein